MAELGEITARLSADVSSFTDGMGRAQTSVQNFQNAAGTATTGTRTFYEGVSQAGEFASGSERGVRRMELALGALGAQMTGTNHAVGMLSEGLLLFSGGSVLAIGVLAGLAAIAGAIELLSINGKTAQRQLEELEKEMDKFGAHGKLMAEQMKLDALTTLQGAMAADPRGALGLAGLVDQWKLILGTGTDIQSLVIEQQGRVRLAQSAFADVLGRDAARDQEKSAREAAKRYSDAYEQAMREAGERMRIERAGAAGAAEIRRVDDEFQNELLRFGNDTQRLIEEQAARSERTAKEWGQRISTALVDGITGKLQDIGNLLKKVVEEFLSKYLITPMLLGLGIASPSGFGAYVGEMLVAGVGQGVAKANLGPMGLNMNLNVAKSGNLSPFDVARDADWQAAFRESSLVAYQGGFRTPGQT